MALFFFFKNQTKLKLISFDVGQGDAHLITLPNTFFQILIDTGPDETILEKVQINMPPGDNLIDLIIITHSHEDHLGGIKSILENFSVGLIVESGAKDENNLKKSFDADINKLEIPTLFASRGEKINFRFNNCSFCNQTFSLEILHPFYSKGAEYKNLNNASVVFLFKSDIADFLFLGDLEAEGETELLNYLLKKTKLTKDNPSVQNNVAEDKLRKDSQNMANDFLTTPIFPFLKVVKVPHHGSKTSLSEIFLKELDFSYAIISVGENNSFNHPNKETLEKLQQKGVEILRTDEIGDIVIEL